MGAFFQRLLDILLSSIGLILTAPLILLAIVIVFLTDFHNPFYIPQRIGKDGLPFKMLKIRSMIVDADKIGIDSTSADDDRVTKIGHLIRKLKLDELIQLFNVLIGDMSLVGPRPNVLSETSLYTDVEKKLLTVKPGITDFSSIIFSDLAEILEGSDDANLKYNQYVRPWKSRLSLFYIRNHNLIVDLRLIFFTALSLVSRRKALNGVVEILKRMKAPENLIEVAKREKELVAFPPPGSDKIVSER